jgi:type I restriction enzyme S subunit
MALAIYREWFVRFRYPGHEDAIFVDSAFGAIPEGWRIERLNAKKMPFRLTKPRVRAYDGVKRYLATADCTGFHRLQAGESLPYHGLPTRAQLQPAPDTVWFGRMAGYKKVLAFPTGSDEIGSFVLSSGFACIECDPGWFGFVLATVLDDSFESTKGRFATGATQVSLTDAGANRTPWLVPPPSVTISFERAVRPLYMEALRLLRTSESVLALRACLLPKLVTGQLDVSHLDLDAVEASVA